MLYSVCAFSSYFELLKDNLTQVFTMLWRKRKIKIFLLGGIVLTFCLFIFTSTVSIDNFTSQNKINAPRENLSPQETQSRPKLMVTRPTSEDLLYEFDAQKKFEPKDFSLDGINKQFRDANKLNIDYLGGQVPIIADPVSANSREKGKELDTGLEEAFQQDHVGRVVGNRDSFNYVDDLLQHNYPNAAINIFNQFPRDQDITSLTGAELPDLSNKSSHKVPDVGQNIISDATTNSANPFAPSEKIFELKKKVAEVSDCLEVSKNKTYTSVNFPDFVQYGKAEDPGENGEPFQFGIKELSGIARERKEKEYETHYFDEWISRKIAVHRSLPDQRTIPCKQIQYAALPTVSVLIVFYNEAWTTLLRTIHSVLDRTPDHLLEEIVLLDDFSDMDHLKEPLEAYVQPMAKVRLLRAKERLGLIRARNIVFEHSSGDVVIFLDSHIECFPGWLEPLLAPIYANNKTVTFPTIEFINPATFAVKMSTMPTHVGGLVLNRLSFNWLYARKPVVYNSADNAESPTMPGGLYAISRSFFLELGMYDPGMELWGSENLEISFKIWMCGGSILLVACSHVGHIFRRTNPALRGRGGLGFKNAVRVAEVWMDQYKHFFYEKILYDIPEFGDVSSRTELRNSLQCQDFAWYLQNVYPELKAEIDGNSIYVGQIMNEITNMCIDRNIENQLSLRRCSHTINQHWNLATNGTIASLDRVIGLQAHMTIFNVTKHNLRIFQTGRRLDNNVDLTWTYDDKHRLVHKNTGLCLQADSVLREAFLKECSLSLWQRWSITTRKELQEIYRNQGVAIDWSL